MSTHGITLYGYCARWASGRTVEPLGTWDSTGQEQLAIESASDEWQGVITATIWAPGAETGTDMLMTDGTCIVPPEALAAPGNGTVTLRCTNEQGRRISVDLAYHSAGHAQVPGIPSTPTPDLWQQYVEQVQADADRAEQASKDAAGSAEAAAESAKQAAQATADISEAKDAALEAIQTAHQATLDDIATDRQQALTDIEQAGDKQAAAITSSGTTQVAAVQQAGQAQQTAIEQAGQSWQQQIAAAGTAELGRWAPAIWDTAPLAAEHDIYAAEGAPMRVTQQGKTEQGADPAPDNPQAIAGTGFNGKVTFDGTETWKAISGIYLGLDNAVPADRACVDRLGFCGRFPYLYAYGNRCLFFAPKNIDGQGTTFYIGQALSAEYGVDLGRWKADLVQWASEGNPLTVYYHAASGTDYTVGISTEDEAGGYHGQALAIGSPLYGDGSVVDTVANDVPSGCDKVIVLDGSEDEDWAVYATATGENRVISNAAVPDAAQEATGLASMYISDTLPAVSAGDTYNATTGVSIYQGNVYVYVPGITDVAGFRAALAANPLKIWYRSTAYTEAADLHIDKVTRRWRMVELDGTEEWSDNIGAGTSLGTRISGLGSTGTGWITVGKVVPATTQAQTEMTASMASGWLYLYTQMSKGDLTSWLAAQKSAGTPVRVLYQLATPEEYASDPHTLPALGSLPETVKTTGQSTVSYSADTKSYIDSKLQAIAAQQLNLMIGGIGT